TPAPEPVTLDPDRLAQFRAQAEAPFTIVLARPYPVVASPPAQPTPAPAAPSAVDQMVKVAPAAERAPAPLPAEPNTNAKILARVPQGTSLRVLGPANGAKEWLRVSWNGTTAYVHRDLVR